MNLALIFVLTTLSGFSQGRLDGIDASTAISYSAGADVAVPILIDKRAPVYSEEAYKARYQGKVKLSLIVGADGKPEDLKVVHSAGLGLDERAVEAVSQWRFTPGKKGGHPLRVAAEVEVTFRLRYWRTTHLEFIVPSDASRPLPSPIFFVGMTGESCGPTSIIFNVGADAAVSGVQVMSIAHESMREHLVKEIGAWRFRNPALRNGTLEPVNAGAKLDLDCGPWPIRTPSGWYWP